MKITLLFAGFLVAPGFAASQKTITIPKDSEIGRYEIHQALVGDTHFPIFLLLDSKTGKTWKFDFAVDVGNSAKIDMWTPVATLGHDSYISQIQKNSKTSQ